MLSHDAPQEQTRKLLRFIRPTAAAAVLGQPRVDAHRVYSCHRFHRRTVPCFGASCPLCSHKVPRDDRILIPLALESTAITAMLDLPMTCHSHLKAVTEKVSSLRLVSLHAFREKAFDEAPVALKFKRLSEGEHVATCFKGVDEMLDAMFRKNVEYALSFCETDKTAATQLRVVRDRMVS